MKKSSHWITLPDEKTEKKSKKSMSVAIKTFFYKSKNRFLNFFRGKESKNEITTNINDQDEKVENKFFWGVGFLFILVFTTVLLAPEQIERFIKGNLFDSLGDIEIIQEPNEGEDIEFIPPFEEQPEFGGEPETEAETNEFASQEEESIAESTSSGSGGGLTPETNPVEVQVEPINEDLPMENQEQAENSETNNEENPIEEEIADEESEEQLNPSAGEEVDEADTDENAKLLEELAQKLDALNVENDQLRAAAADQAAQTNDILGQNQQESEEEEAPLSSFEQLINNNTNQVQTSNQIPSNQGMYRENMHKVNVSPQQILADFNRRYDEAVTQHESNFNTTANNMVNQNSHLNNVPSNPSTGPIEGFLPAIMLTMLIVFGWKCGRIFLKS